jgi:hypothetical protein
MRNAQLLETLSNCLNIDTSSGGVQIFGDLQQGTVKSALIYADSNGKLIAAPEGAGGGGGLTEVSVSDLTATGTKDSTTFLRGDNTFAAITITSSMVTTALGYTPYNGSANPNGFITGITSTMISTALGYTPYNGAANPSGFLTTTTGDARYLKLSGNGTVTGTITAYAFYESSDKRLKTLIKDNYQANGIESITAKLYTKNGVEELGYYAQDVESILPSAVTLGEDGYLSLSYREVHTAKIARLEKEVEELKAQLARL